MQPEIVDGKIKDEDCQDQENNDKLGEPAKTQPNEGNPDEPANSQPNEGKPDEPANSLPNEGKPDEPANSLPNEGKPDEPANSLTNEGKPDEPANSQPNEGKPDEPANSQPNEGKPDEPANSLPNEGKPDEAVISLPNEGKPDEPANSLTNEGKPEGQCKEKPDSEKMMQNSDKQDQPEGALQSKEKPDGKQKKRKLILKKKKNVINGNVDQNKSNTVRSKLAQQKKAKFAKSEGSAQEKNLEHVKVMDQQSKGQTDVPEGTDQRRAMDENNGGVSKRDKNKKWQRVKKVKGSAGFKMEKLKQKIGEASGSMNSEKMTGKLSSHEKGPRHDKTKQKLGGLIFMCSSKTKPDCFRYSVMGVSMNKKDLVLRIKPGLKLFLYDFDLKLLYGVYRATSSGGMKLEPAAFGGAFPVQVKYEVFKDCYPLPESVFKKAIMENYNEKRKFKTELTFEQVKKLTTLFRTVGVGSNAHTRILPAKRDEDTKVHGGVREYRTHSSRARSNRDEYTHVNYGRKARKEEASRTSFPSEREYRTYGLLGRTQSRSPPRHDSSLVPRLDLEREVHLRYRVPLYGDTTTSIRHDPLLMGRNDSRPYSLEGRRELPTSIRHEATVFDGRRYLAHEPISQLDYQTHRPPAVRQNSGLESNRQQYMHPSYDYPDAYSSLIRRDELGAGPYYSLDGRRVVYLPEADSSHRREPEATAFDHNHGYAYPEASRHDPVLAPVSSRYSFGGPSSSYR